MSETFPMCEEERLCWERAIEQWRGSRSRPDMSEEDRVKGALLAYQQQAFALNLLLFDGERLVRE